MNWPANQFLPKFVHFAKRIAFELTDVPPQSDCCSYRKILNKLFYVFAPLLSAVIFYHYLKYLLILNAYRYEQSARKRSGYFRKLSNQLKVLVKRYGNFYFRFMPMNHGITLPRTYTVFAAIREVLSNTDRPAARRIRMSLLFHLMQGNYHYSSQNLNLAEMRLRSDYEEPFGEVDPLSDYNLDIMKCSREMIIQGVKDFEVMSTIFRVLETVVDDMED